MHELERLDRQAHVLEHVHLHWDELHEGQGTKEPASPSLTVAIARQTGTPAAEVAEELGHRLGWPVFDGELTRHVACDLGTDIRQLARFDERSQSWLLECLQSLSSAPQVSETVYVQRLVKVIRSLGAKGNCIIIGRGAPFVLPPSTTLRVCLVGKRADRASTMARRLGLTYKQAERRMDERDQEQACYIQDHFQHDPLDPLSFDLVLNTSQLSPSACAAQIHEALHERETQLNPGSPALMKVR